MRLSLPAFVLLTTSAVAADSDNPVLDAAKKRQEAIKSIEFVCRFTDVTEAGGEGHTRQLPSAKSHYLPLVRETWEGTVRVLIDGDRSRVEVTKTGSGGAGTFRNVVACDGTTVKRYDGSADKKFEKQAFAMIETATARQDWPSAIYQPVLIAARPYGIPGWHPWFPLTKGHSTGNATVIDGVTTDEWSWTESPSDVYRTWFNPQAGHTAQRIRYESKLSPSQTDIIWKGYESGLWLPDSWVTVWTFDDGAPRHTIKATVEQIKVNEAIPASQLDLTFPPGTKVHDELTNSSYLALEDGSLTPFVRGEDLAPSPPPPPVPVTKTPNWFAAFKPFIFGVVLVIVAVALLVLRRAMRKKPGARPCRSGGCPARS